MHIADTPRTNAIDTAPRSARPLALRLLDWIVARDAAYRSQRKLERMPEERLEDMGMTREDVRAAFDAR